MLEGREVYNARSGQLIEIHGKLKVGTNLILNAKRESTMTDEQKVAASERLRSGRLLSEQCSDELETV